MKKLYTLALLISSLFFSIPTTAQNQVEVLQREAQAGKALSQFELGKRYFENDNLKFSPSKGRYWMATACNNGLLDAQLYLADVMEEGKSGLQQNQEEAFRLYSLAAAQGNDRAKLNVGIGYFYGEGTQKNYTEAVRWLTPVAKKGDPKAAQILGDCYMFGYGVRQDIATAFYYYGQSGLNMPTHFMVEFSYLKREARQGDARKLYTVGCCYMNGFSTVQDTEEGLRWLKSAAQQGSTEAMCRLGRYYGGGRRTKALDRNTAYYWYNKAAGQGDLKAIHALARMQNRNVIDMKTKKYVKMLKKGVSLNDPVSMAYLGIHYIKSDKSRNFRDGFQLLLSSARQNCPIGYQCLGVCYNEGKGTAVNHSEAAHYFRKAALNENFHSTQAAIELKKLYIEGKGVEYSSDEANYWQHKADEYSSYH